MAVVDRISQYVEQLPERFQAEVLDFVEYLHGKIQREHLSKDEKDWTVFSLENAMRGMENEDPALYSESDIKSQGL